jgi:hypothetical protein
MAPPHDAPYQIILGSQGRSLRLYGARAAKRGLLRAYVAAVKSIQHHLAADPLDGGDPHNRLQFLGLTLYHGTHDPMHVFYAVDEQRRIVYVREIKPLPGRGLDEAR